MSDPLGQTHSPANDHNSYLKVVWSFEIFRTDGQTAYVNIVIATGLVCVDLVDKKNTNLKVDDFTSLANLLIHQAPCRVVACFCFVFRADVRTDGRTDTMCETNDHLLTGAWWINYKSNIRSTTNDMSNKIFTYLFSAEFNFCMRNYHW